MDMPIALVSSVGPTSGRKKRLMSVPELILLRTLSIPDDNRLLTLSWTKRHSREPLSGRQQD